MSALGGDMRATGIWRRHLRIALPLRLQLSAWLIGGGVMAIMALSCIAGVSLNGALARRGWREQTVAMAGRKNVGMPALYLALAGVGVRD